ncbi:30S ribosomal protein S9 [Thalassoglobus polymorphus]|uniref:Small ribosomal subunit protein uS9 n=1 Tax=Thalassoglobus polymorphus TaxID=2527994 RepID=A0A517QMW6_9PLAN|nr:30S ribosomal protein S9 [Thalassoglobus polymorphus]
MSTDSSNPELPQDDAAPEKPAAPEATIQEPEVPEVAAPAEPEVPAVEATEPTIASGLEIGSEAGEAVSEAEPIVNRNPVIRGKIDRYGVAWGTGRRKTAVARVRLKDGDGKVVINGRTLEEYFPILRDQKLIFAPLEAVDLKGKVDIIVNVKGGGPTGQTGAVVLGIARAIQVKSPELHPSLSSGGFLTRDSRMVERKKYGYKKARKSFQFSKR